MTIASRSAETRANQLSSLPCIENIAELARMSHAMPLLLAVRGKVGSKAPLSCRLSDQKCVMSEVFEEEVWRKERENGRISHEPFVITVNRLVAPWHIESEAVHGASTSSPGSPVIAVEGIERAEGLQSVMQATQTFKAEDNSKSSIARLIIDKAWRMTRTGLRITESYLALGSTITLIGEIDKTASSTSGSYLMRKPDNPMNNLFILSPLTLPQIELHAKRTARALKVISASFLGLGILLSASQLLRESLKRMREARARHTLAKAKKEIEARRRAHLNASRSVQEEGEVQEEDSERLRGCCVICIDKESDVVFSGCGHLCVCTACASKMRGGGKCPICRVKSSIIKVFKP